MPVDIVLRDAQSAEFFDATREGRLMVKRCTNCGQVSEARTEMCPRCESVDLAWMDSAGLGTVTACGVVNERTTDPDAPTRTVIGIVELDEGPWIYSQLVDVAPDTARVGMRVKVGFECPEGGEAVPVFSPAAG